MQNQTEKIFKESSESIARRLARPILWWRMAKKDRALGRAITVIAAQTVKAKELKFDSSAYFLNAALYLAIGLRDINSVATDAVTHPNRWKRSICARMAILTICELDLDKVASGTSLLDAIERSGVSESTKRQAVDRLRSARAVQGRIRKEFADTRNSAIAHRHEDALRTLDLVDSFDWRSTSDTIRQFLVPAGFFCLSSRN